jgi:hypothetical protein
VDDGWVIAEAGFSSLHWHDARGDVVDNHLTLTLDRPTGEYDRLVDDGDRPPQ